MMQYEEREYQAEAEDALLKDVLSSKDCHPIVSIPTGGGKSKILSSFIYKFLEERPSSNVLVLSHTEEILKQNLKAIQSFFPGIRIGMFSSGLKSRTIEKITIAGIQSSYRCAIKFQDFDLCIIDEVHLVQTRKNGNSMYQKFFAATNMQRVGLTATPFRSGHGLIYEGEGRMFNKLSYDLSSIKNFNKLVDDGYLTKLISKPANVEMDVNGLKKSAGDFNLKDLSAKFDRESITSTALDELVTMGHNYKSWLVFAIDTAHADHINEGLNARGIISKVLHSNVDVDRAQLTEDFKNRKIRALVSVGMLCVGFDAPNIDLIALLRPTMSPVLHVQMPGRGLRVHPGKTHCLVLDFAGNIERLGPINDVQVPTKGKKKGSGNPITKRCPNCGCIFHPTVRVCDACGHVFKFQQKLKIESSELEVVRTVPEKKEKWVNVSSIKYSIHEKTGSPDSLKVTYHCGLSSFNEFICYNHTGYAKYKAQNWVNHRWTGLGAPLDVSHLFRESYLLQVPKKLLVDTSSKYAQIKDVEF